MSIKKMVVCDGCGKVLGELTVDCAIASLQHYCKDCIRESTEHTGWTGKKAPFKATWDGA